MAERRFALDDPEGFIDRPKPMVIDEVQRGGDDLLLAIKAQVDRESPTWPVSAHRCSTRFLTVPSLSESLAGRIDLVDLWPLSQGEIVGKQEDLVDRLFEPTASLRRSSPAEITRAQAFEYVCRGGFPEVVSREPRHRQRWFSSYVRTLTERDVGEIVNVRRVDDFAALVRLLATRTGSEINLSALAAELQVPGPLSPGTCRSSRPFSCSTSSLRGRSTSRRSR